MIVQGFECSLRAPSSSLFFRMSIKWGKGRWIGLEGFRVCGWDGFGFWPLAELQELGGGSAPSRSSLLGVVNECA